MIFCFGSNLLGIHGSGSARTALYLHGARMGQGWGLAGNSFAIPTKSTPHLTLDLTEIQSYIDQFIFFARQHQDLEFQVTCIGTNRAGYTHAQIAPLFTLSPDNCYFDTVWEPWLPGKLFWGTY